MVSGCSLLKSAIQRPGWWKGKFVLFWMPAALVGRADSFQKLTPPPPTDSQGARAFTGEGRRLHAETAQSALTIILKLVIGGLTSVILIVSSTVSLQFLGWFVPISLRPVLGIVAAYVMATVWSSCVNFFHLVGFSIYKTAHRTWLRICSIALEEDLKVLDFAL